MCCRWPALTTMAVLDWETFPSDLPLDIWVDEYADYVSTVTRLTKLVSTH